MFLLYKKIIKSKMLLVNARSVPFYYSYNKLPFRIKRRKKLLNFIIIKIFKKKSKKLFI